MPHGMDKKIFRKLKKKKKKKNTSKQDCLCSPGALHQRPTVDGSAICNV